MLEVFGGDDEVAPGDAVGPADGELWGDGVGPPEPAPTHASEPESEKLAPDSGTNCQS